MACKLHFCQFLHNLGVHDKNFFKLNRNFVFCSPPLFNISQGIWFDLEKRCANGRFEVFLEKRFDFVVGCKRVFHSNFLRSFCLHSSVRLGFSKQQKLRYLRNISQSISFRLNGTAMAYHSHISGHFVPQPRLYSEPCRCISQ